MAGVPLPAAPGILVASPAGQPAVGRDIESGLEPGITPGPELSLESSLTSAAPSALARPTDAVGAPAPAPAPAPATATATAAAAATAPALVPVTVTAPAPISPPPAPAAAPALVAQVSGPIFSLASAGSGEHVITIAVTPDNLGPVTVRAHVGSDGIRIELFAPTDGGREALRAILSDLRRDLAGASSGTTTSLDLSSKNEPSGDSGNRREQRAPAAASAPRTDLERRLDPHDNPFSRTSWAADSTIDVLA